MPFCFYSKNGRSGVTVDLNVSNIGKISIYNLIEYRSSATRMCVAVIGCTSCMRFELCGCGCTLSRVCSNLLLVCVARVAGLLTDYFSYYVTSMREGRESDGSTSMSTPLA